MGSKCFPPGFRFHPTDEELVLYYLKRKICRRSLQMDIIAEVDVYKWDPEELPGLSKLKTGDRQWFFFSPRDRKYPNSGRSSRATRNGYWKATGKDRVIKRKSSSVGNIKTLVYYQGRAPSGLRTDWVMHEYTLNEEELKRCPSAQEHYVLSKIFKKSGAGPKNGEQYGAPFVEEEWDDEDCLDIDSLLAQKPISDSGPGPINKFENINTQEETGFSDDIVALLHKIIDQPEALPEPVTEGSTSHVEKDFLEIDDLIGPEMGICDPVTDFNSLSEFDFYHNMDNLEFGPGPGGPENGHEFLDELPVSYNLWNHCDQNVSSMTSMQTVSRPVSNPSSGVVIEGNVAKPEYYLNLNQCPENTDNNNPDSQFSSALWAFVDSIPTTPASASESSALVNRAFKRISSFSRGRIVNLASSASTTSRTTTMTRLGKPSSSRSIVFFSVLGVLFAILWVFVGSSIELLNRFVWL
ncbi:NAC domain-containing protein 17-like [Bidens hawaiensis]|uniref:NAC domain-containing protein 17-like n=1 Tax=Bidens hawaiensis TaxID=980011 RepID=UPI00404A1C49